MPRKRQLKTERQRRLLSKSPTSSWVSARDSLRLETGTMPIWYVACARPCYQSSAPVLNTCCQQIMSHLPALYAPSYEALREGKGHTYVYEWIVGSIMAELQNETSFILIDSQRSFLRFPISSCRG